MPQQNRDLVVIDMELDAARRRREVHDDELSRAGNLKTIDALLDERYQLAPTKTKTN